MAELDSHTFHQCLCPGLTLNSCFDARVLKLLGNRRVPLFRGMTRMVHTSLSTKDFPMNLCICQILLAPN